MGVTVPDKVDAMHEAKLAKMNKVSDAAFDKAYVMDMIKAVP